MGPTDKLTGTPVEVAEFYHRLIKLQESFAQKIELSFVSPGEIKSLLSQGKPLLTNTSPPVSNDVLAAIVQDVGKLIIKHQPDYKEIVEQILKTLVDSDLVKIAAGYFSDKEISSDLLEKLEVNEAVQELALFIFAQGMRPIYLAYGELSRTVLAETQWLKSCCPVCGEQADLGKLGADEGRRYLICSSCETEWRFPRFSCPGCGTEDPNHFHYLVNEDRKEHQVHVCDNCKSYLKTYDARESKTDKNPLIQDVETLYLDELAIKEGYRNERPVN